MNKKRLNAAYYLYRAIGRCTAYIRDDYANGFLTENTGRDGNSYLWFNDGIHEMCIGINSLRFLTDSEIEEQFC